MDTNRKRIAEECRKRRIFNSKQRQIGIDVEALNNQVHERLLIKASEEEKDKKFAEETKRQSHLAERLERQKNDEVREKNKKLLEFWKTIQNAEKERKEFDWYDTDLKKTASTDRICSISGLQNFGSKDLECKDRSLEQKKHVQDMLLQQIMEKRMRKMEEETERRKWESVMLQKAKDYQRLDEFAKKRRQEAAINLIAENQRLAKQKAEALTRQKADEDIEKQKDVEFHVYGCLGGGANRREMSKDQLKELSDEFLKQIAEKQKQKDHEVYEQSLWNKHFKSLEESCKRLELEQRNRRQKLDEEFLMANERLAQEQRRQQDSLNRVVYTNVPSNEFFDKFNTTSR